MTPFDALKIYGCRKHCEKRRNWLKQAISPFLTMVSTLYDTYFSFSMHFQMSSASSFNLDLSKIFSSDNGLNDGIFHEGTENIVNSLPNNKLLGWSKLKELADNKISLTEKIERTCRQQDKFD